MLGSNSIGPTTNYHAALRKEISLGAAYLWIIFGKSTLHQIEMTDLIKAYKTTLGLWSSDY